ncbi:D-hexose-6-phosphate mutarotase [Pseudoxanthomonas sp. UTMC 1351]|uniref:D-hexose-6-phosphate mutarotase n=1 Tax=Pseudoxanthomonas sp. UTMC 1351 TaxID=2695853 RepID=UPI0034CDF4A1
MTPSLPGLRVGRFQDIEAVCVDTPFSTAAISLHGAQVLSFVPQGFGDVMWLSPDTRHPPQAIRGGIPVCWPYFARQGRPDDVPQHGYARTSVWNLADAQHDEDGTVMLEFALPNETGAALDLSMTVRIGRALEQSLTTHNRSAEPQRLTQALHTYFAVADAAQARAIGLDGLTYANKYDSRDYVQEGEWNLHDPRDPGRSDRIYADTGNHFELLDPAARRRITLRTSGSRTLVVWNPGAEGARTFTDMPPEGWRRFVCLEVANAGTDVIELAPGAQHTLGQTITVSGL